VLILITMISIISAFIFPFLNNYSCPDVRPMTNFNTSEYIRSTWYVQQQQINGYQPPKSLFCVAQTLNYSQHHVPFFNGSVLDVFNYGRLDAVNGTQMNPHNYTLCARQINSSLPSEIANAPCLIPNILAGPYWVIDAGPNSSNYEWAIVSGGPPTIQYSDGNCSTSLTGVNGAGLWLFTRQQFGKYAMYYVDVMRSRLLDLGYTISNLLNVSQRGCEYNTSYIKY
jgi:hypothetical protein